MKDNPITMKKRVNRWRENNREYSRELGRAEYQRNKENYAKKEIDPLKAKAHQIAKKIEISKCSNCGSKENLVRHHEDYSKPLDITPLCKLCHNRLHRERETGSKKTQTSDSELNNSEMAHESPKEPRPDILKGSPNHT